MWNLRMGIRITSLKIINDYMEIVSGRQLLAEILNCNERMNLAMTVELMKACENMMRLKMYDDVCDILLQIGYSCKKSDISGMSSRISALKSRAQYDLDKQGKERRTKGEAYKESIHKRGCSNRKV